MRILLYIAACAALAGCATTTMIPTTGGHAVPAERVLDNGFLTDRPGTGIVVVKRDTIPMAAIGPTCLMRVFVNAQPIADLKGGEKVAMYLPPGEYIFGVQACGGAVLEAGGEVTVARPLAYRIGSTTYAGNFFTPTMF